MAEDGGEANVKQEDDGDGDVKDESVDLCGAKFDPAKALSDATKVRLPAENAKVYDNVAMFAAKTNCGTETESAVVAAAAAAAAASSSSSSSKKLPKVDRDVFDAMSDQRFLPHQMPVKSTRIQKGDVLTRMDRQLGPLSALKECMRNRTRVKVVTRNERGIRGYCLGFVEAFDMQWNMAMSDVLEVWTRRRKKKIFAGHDELKVQGSRQQQEQLTELKNVPKVQVTPAGKGVEKCERHMPQIVMRGEHVVMVVVQK